MKRMLVGACGIAAALTAALPANAQTAATATPAPTRSDSSPTAIRNTRSQRREPGAGSHRRQPDADREVEEAIRDHYTGGVARGRRRSRAIPPRHAVEGVR